MLLPGCGRLPFAHPEPQRACSEQGGGREPGTRDPAALLWPASGRPWPTGRHGRACGCHDCGWRGERTPAGGGARRPVVGRRCVPRTMSSICPGAGAWLDAAACNTRAAATGEGGRAAAARSRAPIRPRVAAWRVAEPPRGWASARLTRHARASSAAYKGFIGLV